MLPFRNKEEIVSSLQNTIHGLIYGFFGTAIIGFIIALIGLKILGIGSPFLWAAVFGILVLIPSVGSTLCYIPMAIFFFFQGDYFSLIGILILGGILSTVETFGKPYLIGKKTSISPLVIIFGIFGGLVVFGAVGLLIGPIILSITLTLLEEFTTEDEIKNKMD